SNVAIQNATRESYLEHLKKLKEDIEKKTGKSTEQLYKEKRKRLWDAIELKQPDKVPVVLGSTYFPAKYAGIPYSSAYYDPLTWKVAYTQMMSDFSPDTWGTAGASSGAVLDILKAKNVLWPGGTLPPDVPQQNVDDEYMKEDEYDLFIEDTTDFTLRRYLPRTYGALEPLANLSNLAGRGAGLAALTPLFTTPEFQEVGKALQKAGEEQKKFREIMGNLTNEMETLGFPPMSGAVAGGAGGGAGGPVFDQLANSYRGWTGIITDMYRRPEKLITALEKLNRKQMDGATPADNTVPGPKLGGGGAIHRGSDRFLSKKQWEKFYWPTWKESMMKSIELGYTVSIFAEGFCEERFEYFLELPKGKVMIRFTDTDMFKAKEALGDHFCLMGAVPLTLLQTASPSEVDEYCKKLIQVCGKGGGYILRTDTDYIQEAKVENVKAMMDSVEKYGWY
ncbi:uroporphyrinogen decarboxylase family protein, partial [Chloroflexota bacterium]